MGSLEKLAIWPVSVVTAVSCVYVYMYVAERWELSPRGYPWEPVIRSPRAQCRLRTQIFICAEHPPNLHGLNVKATGAASGPGATGAEAMVVGRGMGVPPTARGQTMRVRLRGVHADVGMAQRRRQRCPDVRSACPSAILRDSCATSDPTAAHGWLWVLAPLLSSTPCSCSLGVNSFLSEIPNK